MSEDEMSFEYIGRDLRTFAESSQACNKENQNSKLNKNDKGNINSRKRTIHEIERDVRIRGILTTQNIMSDSSCVSQLPLLSSSLQDDVLHSNSETGVAGRDTTEADPSSCLSVGGSLSGTLMAVSQAPPYSRPSLSEKAKHSTTTPLAGSRKGHLPREQGSHHFRNYRGAFVARNALCEVDPVTKQCMQVNMTASNVTHSPTSRAAGFLYSSINRAPRRGRFSSDGGAREKRGHDDYRTRSHTPIQCAEASHFVSGRTFRGRREGDARDRRGRGG